MNPTIPPEAAIVLKTLEAAGHAAYLVGGAVRDLLSGRQPRDCDVATSATPDCVAALFAKTIPTGIKHGTVTVLANNTAVEVTTFRRDGTYSDHRRPGAVTWTHDLTADLARRDFTIGAMALDLRGNLFDPFGGRDDLDTRTLRAVGDPDTRFQEDALRMLRAVRFASRGFAIEPNTLAAIERNAHLSRYLSPERVANELAQILRGDASHYAYMLLDLGLLRGVVPDSDSTDRSDLNTLPPDLRFYAFAASIQPNRTEALARSLRLDRRTVAACRAVDMETVPDSIIAWKRLFCRLGDERTLAVAAASGRYADAQQIITSGEPRNLSMLAVSGDDLIAQGFRGKEVGTELRRLFEATLE